MDGNPQGVEVFEERRRQEIDFVRAAAIGIVRGTIEAEAVLAACPVDMVTHDRAVVGVYTAIDALCKQHEKPDPVNVAEWLKASKDFQGVNAAEAAAFVYGDNFSIFSGNDEAILHLASVVRREGLKQRAESALVGLVSDCQRYGNDPSEIATAAANIAETLEDGCADMADHSLSAVMQRLVEKLKSGEAAMPLPTPWPSLNRVLKGGLVPGELAVLAGRPGMGKTALAGCLAVEVARQDKPVLFISREVADETVAARMLAREGRVDLRYFRQGIANAPHIMAKIEKTQGVLDRLPLKIVEKSVQPMTVREVRRLAKREKRIALIVVDYLQLMESEAKRDSSREREVAEMSRRFKQLALDCDCPVLLLSQLNRSSETGNRQPELSDLRESGAIEQDADIVLFLHTEKRFLSEAKMAVKCIVAKGRSSGTGYAWLNFDKAFADFTEGKPPEKEESQPRRGNGL